MLAGFELPDMKHHVRASESAGAAVKRVVAGLEECRRSELGTLEQVVAVEWLDTVVESAPPDAEGVRRIVFQYCGYSLEVASDRTIHVEN